MRHSQLQLCITGNFLHPNDRECAENNLQVDLRGIQLEMLPQPEM